MLLLGLPVAAAPRVPVCERPRVAPLAAPQMQRRRSALCLPEKLRFVVLIWKT